MTPNIPSLPQNAEILLERKEWENYAVKIRDGKSLSKNERDRLEFLTAKFSPKPPAQEDSEPLAAAYKAGSFAEGPPKKATKSEIFYRISMVSKWIAAGKPFDEIVQYAAENWGIGYRQTCFYRQKAEKAMQKRMESITAQAGGLALHMIVETYSAAVKGGDVSGRTAAIKLLMDLTGKNVQRQEISGPNGAPLGILDIPEKDELDES